MTAGVSHVMSLFVIVLHEKGMLWVPAQFEFEFFDGQGKEEGFGVIRSFLFGVLRGCGMAALQ